MVSFGPTTAYKGWWQPLGHLLYGLRHLYRFFRVQQPTTWCLGSQYQRSRDLLEIDITYECNLHCWNCNRSCTQAPTTERMSFEQICAFCKESVQRNKQWRRIRILGGEPTTHPDLQRILVFLQKTFAPAGTRIELATNGWGPVTCHLLRELPTDIVIDNSRKTRQGLQPSFRPFNRAPVDQPAYRFVSFENACAIAQVCGMGLTPYGYYCCAVAGGIDRVVGYQLGVPSLPTDDDSLETQTRSFCRLCGRFLDGHFIPHNLRPSVLEPQISPTWQQIYQNYAHNPPKLLRYAEDREVHNPR